MATCVATDPLIPSFLLGFGLPVSAVCARAHLVPLSATTRKRARVPLHALLTLPLQLLLLFWPYGFMGAEFVLSYWLFRKKVARQARMGS